ncbi:MAG: segregation/condensation protein A [Candidatus Margulisiibacteriota bacterium]
MSVEIKDRDLTLKLESFEGPFDVLLAAIKDGKIDIYSISLSQITDQYLSYLKAFEKLALNPASEYLVMAAYLIEMKARSLLPQPQDPELAEQEEEIEADLASHLQAFKFFKQVADTLKEKQQKFMKVYSRYHHEVAAPEKKEIFLVDVSLEDLVRAFQNLYISVKEEESTRTIPPEEISLSQRIDEVVEILNRSSEAVDFEALFIRRTRLEVVVTFLAVLELTRQKKISLLQDKRFGGIKVGWRQN